MNYREALRAIDRHCPIPSARATARKGLLAETREQAQEITLELVIQTGPWKGLVANNIRQSLKNGAFERP